MAASAAAAGLSSRTEAAKSTMDGRKSIEGTLIGVYGEVLLWGLGEQSRSYLTGMRERERERMVKSCGGSWGL